jgi:hypothetical protein
MTNMTELIKNLRGASVRLYLLKKEGRKNFSAFRLPNGIDNDIKEKYCTNLEHFIDGRSFGTYDFVHTEKNALIELETEKVSLWTSMQASLKKADDENIFLQTDNFDDDYSVIVIDYSYRVESEIVHTYIISKYMKTDTWYKKGVKFAFTANGLVEKKSEIIVLNGCIDVVINGDSIVILNEKNFENLFNYHGNGKEHVGFYHSQTAQQTCRSGFARHYKQVASACEREQYIECLAEHVCHRQDSKVVASYYRGYFAFSELEVCGK